MTKHDSYESSSEIQHMEYRRNPLQLDGIKSSIQRLQESLEQLECLDDLISTYCQFFKDMLNDELLPSEFFKIQAEHLERNGVSAFVSSDPDLRQNVYAQFINYRISNMILHDKLIYGNANTIYCSSLIMNNDLCIIFRHNGSNTANDDPPSNKKPALRLISALQGYSKFKSFKAYRELKIMIPLKILDNEGNRHIDL